MIKEPLLDACRICQAIQRGAKVEGKQCVVLDLDGVLTATTRLHQDSCDGDAMAEAVGLLRLGENKGKLVELPDVGHWGLSFIPTESGDVKSRTRN